METVTTNTQDVALVTDGGSFTVAPGMAILYVGDTITFHNLTKENATVIFPDPRLFGGSMDNVGPNQKLSKVIPDTFKDFGSYPYAVYYPDRREFAHASMPIIIIYPRKD